MALLLRKITKHQKETPVNVQLQLWRTFKLPTLYVKVVYNDLIHDISMDRLVQCAYGKLDNHTARIANTCI